ncbi:MAG: DUF6265 family protein [Bacteroidota bacterium]
MHYTTRFLILFLVAVTACTSRPVRQDSPIQQMTWLLGTWEMATRKGRYETWTKAQSDELRATGFVTRGADTIILETIRVIQQRDSLIYVANVKNQNEGKDVVFRQEALSASEFTFHNPDHDFPQTISYCQVEENLLVATISGIHNNAYTVQTTAMRRKSPEF